MAFHLESKLEIGKLYFKSCDFDLALSFLDKNLQRSFDQKDYLQFTKYFPILLRILSEKSEFEKIETYLAKIESLMELLPAETQSKIFYTKGISYVYQGNLDKAHNQFLLARKTQITTIDEIAASFGLATIALRTPGDIQFSLLMHQINLLITKVGDCDFTIASLLLESHYFIQKKLWQKALDLLNLALKSALTEQNIYMVLNVHYTFGRLYQAKDDPIEAKKYYHVCESFLIKKDLKHFHDQVLTRLEEIKKAEAQNQVIKIQHSPKPSLKLASGEVIGFKNQFTLHKLFTILAQANGQNIKKEDIVTQLWRESYHPFQHDNKLHVTICRLRKMLSKHGLNNYILNSEDGYKLPSSIQIQQQELPHGSI
jgi:tetratricopeptide (TPR) repeat protein